MRRRHMCLLAAAVALRIACTARPRPIMVYVSNEKDNTVTVVDSATMEVVKTIKVGQRPRGITISHDGKFIYLCASDDDTIEMIDTATHEIVGIAAVRARPGALRAVARRQDALRRQRGRQSRHRDRHRMRRASWPKSRSASSRKAWASARTARPWSTRRKRRTWRISSTPSTHEITDNVLVDSRPRFAEFKPDGSEVWVSAEIGGTVSVIDNATREVKHKITFEIPGLRAESIQPVGVRITADGKKAYVALGPANRVAVVNTETYEVEKYVLVGQRVWQLAFTPDQKTDHQHQRRFQRHHLHRRGHRRAGAIGDGRGSCRGASSSRRTESNSDKPKGGNMTNISDTRFRGTARRRRWRNR